METVGESFKRARKSQKIDLNTVSQYLKISESLLGDIENNQFPSYINVTFLIGHIRSYAKYLNLDEKLLIENFKIQIRKGLLEFCILQIISRNEVYTSDIIEELKNSKIIVVEGTVYPLLNRLKTSVYIKYEWKESKQGPPRKYYSITESGINYIKELIVSWNEINSSVKKLLNTKK